MGMFDYYQPTETLLCPVCHSLLQEWQGTDGPCALFVWHQGLKAPVEQRVDEEVRLPPAALVRWRLPDTFSITSDKCACAFSVTAIGRTEDDVWTTTHVITAETARQASSETRAQFKARLRWLQGQLR